MQSRAFVFFGRSGGGKGTQVERLVEYFRETDPDRGIIRVETGKLLRGLMTCDTLTGRRTKAILDEGGLMPEFVPIYLWAHELITGYSGTEHVILDGVSRRLPEASVLHSALNFYRFEKKFIIHINISRETALTRLLGRGRVDDNEEDIKARLDWFEDNVVRSIEYFRKITDCTFLDIDGERDVETVYKDILSHISK